MSRIMYNTNNEEESIKLPNYLIVHNNKITQANSIQKVMEIVTLLKCACSIYQLTGTKGYDWSYLIDMEKEEF